MNSPSVGIVIPIIQTRYIFKLLDKIKSIINNKYVICVVNDGNQKINKYLEKKLSQNIELLNLDKNLCFAGANNSGWKYLINKYPSIKYLGTINDDTIPDSNWIQFMESTLRRNPNVAACSPGMITYNGIFKNKKKYYSIWKLGDKKNPMILDRDRITDDTYVSVFSGFCFLAKVNVLQEINFFDEKYKNSCEDIDLCLKIRKKNYDLMVTANTYVAHYGGRSRFKYKLNTNIQESRKVLIDKWGEDLKKYNLD